MADEDEPPARVVGEVAAAPRRARPPGRAARPARRPPLRPRRGEGKRSGRSWGVLGPMIVGKGPGETGRFPNEHRLLEERGPWGKPGFPHGSEPKASDDHACSRRMRPTTPSASPMIRKASSKRSAGTRFATTGDRSTRPAAEQLDQPRPDGGRVPDAADQLEVAQDKAVRRHAQLAARAGDAERDDAPAFAGEPRRQLDGRHRARRLDDEVELALVSGRPARDVDRLGRSERARELELRLADPVGDDRGRREQLREDDRQRPERADADDPDSLPRSADAPAADP